MKRNILNIARKVSKAAWGKPALREVKQALKAEGYEPCSEWRYGILFLFVLKGSKAVMLAYYPGEGWKLDFAYNRPMIFGGGR